MTSPLKIKFERLLFNIHRTGFTLPHYPMLSTDY
jgi:hypothetical protein